MWAARRRFSGSAGRQLRDPYVLPHPDSTGFFCMPFSQGGTNTVAIAATLVVRLARNRPVGSMRRWLDFSPSAELLSLDGPLATFRVSPKPFTGALFVRARRSDAARAHASWPHRPPTRRERRPGSGTAATTAARRRRRHLLGALRWRRRHVTKRIVKLGR